MSNKSKITLGIIGAVAAGVVIGLLVAPAKGSEMRKRLKDTAGDWADRLASKSEEAMDTMKDGMKRAKDAAKERMGRVKEAV